MAPGSNERLASPRGGRVRGETAPRSPSRRGTVPSDHRSGLLAALKGDPIVCPLKTPPGDDPARGLPALAAVMGALDEHAVLRPRRRLVPEHDRAAPAEGVVEGDALGVEAVLHVLHRRKVHVRDRGARVVAVKRHRQPPRWIPPLTAHTISRVPVAGPDSGLSRGGSENGSKVRRGGGEGRPKLGRNRPCRIGINRRHRHHVLRRRRVLGSGAGQANVGPDKPVASGANGTRARPNPSSVANSNNMLNASSISSCC